MRYRLGVVCTVGPGCRLWACGSRAELGAWDPRGAAPLAAASTHGDASSLEPSFFWGDVEMDEEEGEEEEEREEGVERKTPLEFSYKFIKTEESAPGRVVWEGCGPAHNRQSLDAEELAEALVDGVVCLPIGHWIEEGGHTDEWRHTTAFYRHIAERHSMHYSRVLPRLWLGSCPRVPAHVSVTLRSALGATALVNLQTAGDVEANWGACAPEGAGDVEANWGACAPEGAGDVEANWGACAPEGAGDGGTAAPRHLQELCRREGIAYVWLPTADMSTEDRTQVLPQAAWILHGLLAGGHVVYVHCNAGVGRAAAAVAGYLCHVLGWTPRRAHYHLAARRPAVYLDNEALARAAPDFRRKFGAALALRGEEAA
uniref:Laforin n=1 Tax=Petromyzon marinus TaxID=7757 RepID=A0AAJ7SK25_PETMA